MLAYIGFKKVPALSYILQHKKIGDGILNP